MQSNPGVLTRFRLSCRRFLVAVTVVTVLTPGTQIFAALDFGVDIDIGVIRSDNILLAPDGEEQTETIYTIAPQFYITSDDDRFQADIRYRPEAYFYSEFDDADDVFHVLDASLTAALISERFFIDLNAASFQSIIIPEERIPSSNIPITTNRTDAKTFEARPYWRSRVGQADLLLEAGYSRVDYDDDTFQSSNELGGRFELNNFERQQGLAWGIDYEYRRAEYEISMPWEFQRAALNLGFWVGGNARIFAVGGAETSIENFFESNMDADFWEAGIQYRPSQRLNVEVAVGDRSYGTSVRGTFSYELRRGAVSVTYSEDPANSSELMFNYRPINDTDNLDNILDVPGASDRFLRRRGEINTSIELSKSELSLRMFAESREQRTTAGGDSLQDEELSGVAVRWSWRIGNKTSLGIGADIAKRNQSGFDDELRGAQINIDYQLTQRLSARLEGVRFDQKGRLSSDSDYTENQIRLLLRTSF